MKKYFTLLIVSCIATIALAQAPQKFSYQAVLRDAGNQLLVETEVGVQVSIIEASAFLPVYVENHTGQTNTNGLLTLQIGAGEVMSGEFESIDWGNGEYSIQIDTDPEGGENYTLTGLTELLSVPFALYAANASQNAGTLNEAYNAGGAGNGRTITANSGSVEIVNTAGNTTGLSITSDVANSFGIDATQNASGVALRARSLNAANTFAAVQVESNSTVAENAALTANNSGAGYALAGQIPANATGGAAVYGSNLRSNGGTGVSGIGFNGVSGIAQNAQGFGVYGANNNPGNETVPAIGTYGIGFNGVYGQTTNVTQGWAGYFTADLGVDGTGFALGGWVNASDSRLKSNVVPIDNALDKLTFLSGKHYTLTTKSKDAEGRVQEQQREQYGVMAQELENVFPEMIAEKAIFINAGDATEYKTVEYTQLIPVLLEAIKELKAEVDALKEEIENLKSE